MKKEFGAPGAGKRKKNMLVINLFGAPGAGKSTAAAYIFAKLKMAGIKCELVTEFAKDVVWEDNKAVLNNQVKILGEQYLRMTRLQDKVDVIITDSPLFNSAFYNRDTTIEPEFHNLVLRLFNNFENFNILVTRVRPYVQEGRLQSEEESDQLGKQIKKQLEQYRIDYMSIPGDETAYSSTVQNVLEKYFMHNHNNS